MNEQVTLSRAGAAQTGRPTREYAQRRQEDLLERALEMFAQTGFELTTIDAIAASLNMTKRTIYARYKDKAALFEAAMKRAIARWFIPLEVLRGADTGDLETALIAIARIRVGNNMSREGLRLQRIVTSEAFRFPEVFRAYEMATMTVIQFLVELFEKYRGDRGWGSDPELAATSFLAIVNSPARTTLLFNRTPKPAEVEAFINKSVRLLLDGMRPR
jgi:AcrR family transcriptional regulator